MSLIKLSPPHQSCCCLDLLRPTHFGQPCSAAAAQYLHHLGGTRDVDPTRRQSPLLHAYPPATSAGASQSAVLTPCSRQCDRGQYLFRHPECVRPGRSWAISRHDGPCWWNPSSMTWSSSSVHMSPCCKRGSAVGACEDGEKFGRENARVLRRVGGGGGTGGGGVVTFSSGSSSSQPARAVSPVASEPDSSSDGRSSGSETSPSPDFEPRLFMRDEPRDEPRAIEEALQRSRCQRFRTASAERSRGSDFAMVVHL